MGTNFSSLDDILEEDMHYWYTKFMKESPSGVITLFELKTMLDMTGMTEEASSYVDQVFFTFDMDGVRPFFSCLCDSLTSAQCGNNLPTGEFLMLAPCRMNQLSSIIVPNFARKK